MTQEQLELLREYVRVEVQYQIEAEANRASWIDEKYAEESFAALVASFSEDQK